MKKRCSLFRRFIRSGACGWMKLTPATLLVLLFSCPLVAYAAMPGNAPMPMPDNPVLEGAPGMPQSGDGGPISAPGAPDVEGGAIALPGAAVGAFGPSEITTDGIITLSVCALILCGGLVFCLFFRRSGKSF